MKIAAFGDIHSNHFALEACLDAAERLGIDGVVFLGDYVSDCPCPQKTMRLIRQTVARFPVWMIRGNREEYLLRHRENPMDGWSWNSRTGSLLYTYENLSENDLDDFAAMPICMKVHPEGMSPFEICHGAPWQTRLMLRPDTSESDAVMNAMSTGQLLCAHTHERYVYCKNGKTIVNGGALGLPTGGRTDASFAVIEFRHGEWIPGLKWAAYDIDAAVREFRESGFMEAAKVWARAMAAALRTGRDYAVECLRLVEEYVRMSGLPFDSEVLWERAAEKLEI